MAAPSSPSFGTIHPAGRPRLALVPCIALAGMACTGCSTILDPYLDTTRLNTDACLPATSSDPAPSCGARERFRGAHAAVVAMQTDAYTHYHERGIVGTTTSALAFPLAGYLLYRSTIAQTANERSDLLAAGVTGAALYGARNAALSGSPESVYLLADARLSCVLGEADKYGLLGGPATSECETLAARIDLDMAAWPTNPAPDQDLKDRWTATSAKARQAVDLFRGADAAILDAAATMRDSARRIAIDANLQIRNPGISLSQATAFMTSEVSGFGFTPQAASSSAQTHDRTLESVVNADDVLGQLVEDYNRFLAKSCVQPRPVSTVAMGNCATYSPALPVAPVVTTTLPGNATTLAAGQSVTFIATSTPTGQPWATLTGDVPGAQAALEPLDQRTLSPTQTQVTVKYRAAVATPTKATIAITPTGGSATPTLVTVSLQEAGRGGSNGAPADAATPAPTIDFTKLDFTPVNAAGKAFKTRWNVDVTGKPEVVGPKVLGVWRLLCDDPTGGPADPRLLVSPAFVNAVKTVDRDPNGAYCGVGKKHAP